MQPYHSQVQGGNPYYLKIIGHSRPKSGSGSGFFPLLLRRQTLSEIFWSANPTNRLDKCNTVGSWVCERFSSFPTERSQSLTIGSDTVSNSAKPNEGSLDPTAVVSRLFAGGGRNTKQDNPRELKMFTRKQSRYFPGAWGEEAISSMDQMRH